MITSVNLAGIPFIGQTDSTRLQMSSKQVQQSLTSLNCDIPFVCSENYYHISHNSPLGLLLAKSSGYVKFNDGNIIILFYDKLNKIEVYDIPLVKKTSANYASKLRFSLSENSRFEEGDIIYEYDNFINSIPTFGYNVMTALMSFFGFNHEDSIVVSESFSNKAKAQYIDKVYVPIYEYTLLQKIYKNDKNSFEYFPGIGEKLKDDIVCCYFTPKNSEMFNSSNPTELKNKILLMLKNMNISDLINMNTNSNNLIINKIKSNLEKGKINGFRIHKLKQNIKLLDIQLQKVLEYMYTKYGEFILDTYNNLNNNFDSSFVKKILKEYYVYSDTNNERGNLNLKDVVYLLEFEIVKEDYSYTGDKFANRYAGKGVISLILPDDLRPFAIKSELPIDYITNTFGVYSRMNLGQIPEVLVGKNVMFCDYEIKKNPQNTKKIIEWLNDNVIKYLNNTKYYNEVKSLINKLEEEEKINEFIKEITNSNLYIEAPAFTEIDVRNLLKNGINPNEDILIKKELLTYMEEKLKIKFPFKKEDCILPNIFCGPMYLLKLYKIASKISWARDLGNVKGITKQPLRGRAKSGGSKLGYYNWPLHTVMFVE